MLALILEIMSNEERWNRLKAAFNREGHAEAYREMWNELKHLTPKQVSDTLRNSLDMSYHRLRALWEVPLFKNALTDPLRIEAYRKVLLNHLSKQILKDLKLQSVLNNPQEFRNQFLKVTSTLVRAGDVFLDGVLDVLLDILKGAGRNPQNMASSAYFPKTNNNDNSNGAFGVWEPEMDDPSVANSLLFELSESEDDN